MNRQAIRQLATVSSTAPSASSSNSSTSPTSWKLPIEPGIEPAYDEAIKLINEQSSLLQQQLASLKSEVEKAPLHSPERALAEANLHATSIISQINDPEVRWRFKMDKNVPLSNPVFAHLREKSWRDKSLPRLLERARLMRVVPDAISDLTPTADVQVAFGEGSGIHDHGGEAGDVTVGCFVDANKSMKEPTITVTPFHTEECLYTLALVDLDAPDVENDRLSTYAHWLVHNVPLSVTKTQVQIKPEQIALSYIPPHPQNGTKYHRYGLLLFKQDESKAITPAQGIERKAHSVRDLVEEHKLHPCGLHFWRAQWSQESRKSISKVYKDILQVKEPIFTSELA
ncbi:PEBP-like protein [Meira miltonrushii]|uniref:PEBP-like protein n=1 Tax=Meira miltonrushii TaxID=1280837 RepID=A0A316V9V8_9BASI|nr:PEBP-like protein [Meira miltonrushii]PWN33848.1 PEBP-like protein [Meira miltonrushii]